VRPTVLIDTGPLVALLRKADRYHHSCVELVKADDVELITCWPVITEAAWLLRKRLDQVLSLMRFFSEGLVELSPLGPDAPPWITAFFERYREHEPQLADASLLYLAARLRIDTIFTLDRKDFAIYRLPGNKHLRIVPGQE
jgi:predicted nucleic acid-binding protein